MNPLIRTARAPFAEQKRDHRHTQPKLTYAARAGSARQKGPGKAAGGPSVVRRRRAVELFVRLQRWAVSMLRRGAAPTDGLRRELRSLALRGGFAPKKAVNGLPAAFFEERRVLRAEARGLAIWRSHRWSNATIAEKIAEKIAAKRAKIADELQAIEIGG